MPSRSAPTAVSPIFLLLIAVTVGGGWLCVTSDATDGPDGAGALLKLGTVLLVLGGWAVTLCLHEFGHAVLAYRGGDLAVADKGYLTLDIRRYAHPGLTFVLPLIFVLVGGVPLPGAAVWINNWAIRSRCMQSLVSLAGPMINLICGILLALATGYLAMPEGLWGAMSYLALIQMLAFTLNILPIPGLDGWGIVEPHVSPDAKRLGAQLSPWAPLVVFAVLVGLPGASALFYHAGGQLLSVAGGDPGAADYGYSQFAFWRF